MTGVCRSERKPCSTPATPRSCVPPEDSGARRHQAAASQDRDRPLLADLLAPNCSPQGCTPLGTGDGGIRRDQGKHLSGHIRSLIDRQAANLVVQQKKLKPASDARFSTPTPPKSRGFIGLTPPPRYRAIFLLNLQPNRRASPQLPAEFLRNETAQTPPN